MNVLLYTGNAPIFTCSLFYVRHYLKTWWKTVLSLNDEARFIEHCNICLFEWTSLFLGRDSAVNDKFRNWCKVALAVDDLRLNAESQVKCIMCWWKCRIFTAVLLRVSEIATALVKIVNYICHMSMLCMTFSHFLFVFEQSWLNDE